MPVYYITFRQYRVATVHADTESAARQAYIDDDLDDIEDGDAELLAVEEG